MKSKSRNFGPTPFGRRTSAKAAFMWIGGFCFLTGSLAVGITGLSSAAPGPGAQTVNQGAAGSSAWPVSATGTVGVNNFPSGFNVNNLPSTQKVSGTVGIDPTANGVHVDNLPATQSVTGAVSISGTPSVTSGDITHLIYDSGLTVASPGVQDGSGDIDVSAYRAVTMYVLADASGVDCVVQYHAGATYTLDEFSPSTTGTVETFDPAPPNLDLTCTNGGASPTGVFWTWDGRAN